jgi:hypothetical protein
MLQSNKPHKIIGGGTSVAWVTPGSEHREPEALQVLLAEVHVARKLPPLDISQIESHHLPASALAYEFDQEPP